MVWFATAEKKFTRSGLGTSRLNPIITSITNTLNASNAGSSTTYSLQLRGAGFIHCTQEKLRMGKEERMKVKVDEETCVGDETCVQICPEIFEMNGDVAIAKMEEVPKGLEEKCKEAAEACPVEAIIIE